MPRDAATRPDSIASGPSPTPASAGPLHVALLCAGWRPDLGGVESHTADLAHELRRRGHRVSALCLDTTAGLEPFGVADSCVDGVELRRVAYGWGDVAKLFDLAVHPGLEAQLDAWLERVEPDVLHVHHLTGWGSGALRVPHRRGLPTAMTLHDYWTIDPRAQLFGTDGRHCSPRDTASLVRDLGASWPYLMPSGGAQAAGPEDEALAGDDGVQRALQAFAKRMLDLPDALFTPSAAAAKVFIEFGLAPERLRVVENGIDVARLRAALDFERMREGPLSAQKDRSVVLGVLGSVLPSKGVLELAEAVVEAALPGLVLEVHGARPAYHGSRRYVERLEALAAEHPELRLMGPFEPAELPRVLARLDGVAAPSLWEEVYGLSVREAAAVGLPVLVSDAGGLPAVADGGARGLVVPRYDRAAWIAALAEFAGPGSRARRAAWSAGGSAQGAAGGVPRGAAAPRSAAEMSAELESLYRGLIARRAAARAG